MKKIEILAPVGGREHLVSAVRSGADAVYLGTKSFNARAGAVNFDENELKEAVSYAHARGVKIHVTLNTLVFDAEMSGVANEIRSIAKSGADAVIVQDLGVAKLVRECCPQLALHASTQMAVHNLEGARILGNLGFSRVVLSRELSFEEIEYITKNCGIETEVFVHGALCMSVSGCCYLSAILGERSGNRGRCAGPCRLNFKSGEREYALSLKDMSHIPYISQLESAGVSSLKIEGRLKRPEYVAVSVDSCVSSRDGLKYDAELLKDAFSRGGFTDGYYKGKRTLDMFGVRSGDDVAATKSALGKIAELTRLERSSVAVDMSLSIAAGQLPELTVTDGENEVTETGGQPPEPAKTKPTDAESAGRNLSKTGGTPFYLNGLTVSNDDSLFVPPATLNDMRRAALDELLALRETVRAHKFIQPEIPVYPNRNPEGKQRIYLCARNADRIDGISADRYILPLSVIEKQPDLIEKYGDALAAELPSLIYYKDGERISAALAELREKGLKTAVAQNIGAVAIAREAGLEVIGGHGLNIMNSAALSEYERLGVSEFTASFELSMDRIRRLGGDKPIGLIAYGRLPLMLFRNCPAKGSKGCGDCKGSPRITDRRGNSFPLLCSDRVYSTLLNPVKLFMSDKNLSGADFLVFYFTDESRGECVGAVEAYANHSAPPEEHTNGLYFRELQ